MGGPMAGHLASAGHEVTVYNRTATKALEWVAEHGHRAAPTAAEAVEGAEFVMMCVGNDHDVREVATAAIQAMQPRRDARRPHDRLGDGRPRARRRSAPQRGLGFVDAPVSGGQAGAQNGQLTVMCGCNDRSVFDAAREVIMAYARECRLLGPAGAGQTTKMVNQICIAGVLQGLAEGVVFAQKAGLDVDEVVDDDQQGRGRQLADGEPGAHDGAGQVRLRVRRRVDAQGPRRSASTRPSGSTRASR